MGTLQYGLISKAVILSNDGVSVTLSDRLRTASLNTLFGLIAVFAVLILIIVFIFLFKILPYLQEIKGTKVTNTNNTVDNVLAQIIENEEEELIEDFELVAVITAAIYASMGDAVPADGLIVRSIRKAGNRRWINA